MSLVLEALRRVEKTGGKTGSVGATVASFRPPRRKAGAALPLFLGLIAGGLAVAFFGPQMPQTKSPAPPERASPARLPGGRAGLPPPMLPPVTDTRASLPDASPQRLQISGPDGVEPPRIAPRVRLGEAAPGRLLKEETKAEALVLQAISQRDSSPIAMINDQLVKEGDYLGSTRVLKIGTDSVEVILENGKQDTVRFAPPPPPDPSPTPEKH